MLPCVPEGGWEEGDECPIALMEPERLDLERGEGCSSSFLPINCSLETCYVCDDTVFVTIGRWARESVDVCAWSAHWGVQVIGRRVCCAWDAELAGETRDTTDS